MDRLRRVSKLPAGKTWDTFEHERAPVKLRQQLERLAEGDFVDRDVNVLAFGLPGTGKTHAMCAMGHGLVQSGRSVLFIPAYRLVQDMLAAKRDLDLPRMLRKLDNYNPVQVGVGVPGLQLDGIAEVGESKIVLAPVHICPAPVQVRSRFVRVNRYGAVEVVNCHVWVAHQVLRDTPVDVRAREVGVTPNGAVEGGDSFIQPFQIQQKVPSIEMCRRRVRIDANSLVVVAHCAFGVARLSSRRAPVGVEFGYLRSQSNRLTEIGQRAVDVALGGVCATPVRVEFGNERS